MMVTKTEAWTTPGEEVHLRLPKGWATERWNYRDNPINGIQEREFRKHFSNFENVCQWML